MFWLVDFALAICSQIQMRIARARRLYTSIARKPWLNGSPRASTFAHACNTGCFLYAVMFCTFRSSYGFDCDSCKGGVRRRLRVASIHCCESFCFLTLFPAVVLVLARWVWFVRIVCFAVFAHVVRIVCLVFGKVICLLRGWRVLRSCLVGAFVSVSWFATVIWLTRFFGGSALVSVIHFGLLFGNCVFFL